MTDPKPAPATDEDIAAHTTRGGFTINLIARIEADRAELAAADQNLKTMLQAAGEEAERQLAAEKARADQAEARVREIRKETLYEAARAVCPGCGRRALRYITEASGPNTAYNWTHDPVDGEGDSMLCAASSIQAILATRKKEESRG